MHNFKWYKIAELSEFFRKNTVFALCRDDHTFEHITLPSLSTHLPAFEIILEPC